MRRRREPWGPQSPYPPVDVDALGVMFRREPDPDRLLPLRGYPAPWPLWKKVVHNVVAHPLLVLCPPLGARLHDATEPPAPVDWELELRPDIQRLVLDYEAVAGYRTSIEDVAAGAITDLHEIATKESP